MLENVNQPQEIKDKLIKFAEDPKGFLVLSGPCGSGKTFAATEIFHLHTEYKLPYYDSDVALFVSQAKMYQEFLKEFSQYRNIIELTRRYTNVHLLVIDDLGTKPPTDAFLESLYSIIDQRYNERKPTIITTNLNAKEVQNVFGTRILSRMGAGICLKLTGDDRRNDLNAF